MTDVRICVRLDADLHARLAEESRLSGKTKVAVVCDAIAGLKHENPSSAEMARCHMMVRATRQLNVRLLDSDVAELIRIETACPASRTVALHYALRRLLSVRPQWCEPADPKVLVREQKQRECGDALRDWLRTERIVFYRPEPLRFVIPIGSEDEGVERGAATAIHVQVEEGGAVCGGVGPDRSTWAPPEHGDPHEALRGLLSPHLDLTDPETLLERVLHDEFGACACEVDGAAVASNDGSRSLELSVFDDDYMARFTALRVHKFYKTDATIWVPRKETDALPQFLRRVKPWLLATTAMTMAAARDDLVKWLWEHYPQGYAAEDEE